MKKPLAEHSVRYEYRDRILDLDPVADCAEIYRTLALYDLVWEIRTGHNLGYYQTLAAPRVAAVLAHTGEVIREPKKRAYDTGLLMYELFAHGFDHPNGRAVVRRLNHLHRGHDITNEDMLYVLTVFAVTPTRFVNEHGWRPLTDHETVATWAFYAELGRRMHVQAVPGSYLGLEEFYDDYVHRHLHATVASAQLMRATQNVVAARLPRPLRPLADIAARTVLDVPTRRALGLAPPPPGAQAALRVATLSRRAIIRRRPPRRASWFTPGAPAGPYPHGYRIDQLGPQDTTRLSHN